MADARKDGFTIVELLTIIVVLGILLGIIFLSYGAWRQKTAETEVKNDLKSLATSMEDARNFQNAYPVTIPSSFTASPNVTVTLKSASSTAYCAEGVSKVNSSVQFKIQNGTTEPVVGIC